MRYDSLQVTHLVQSSMFLCTFTGLSKCHRSPIRGSLHPPQKKALPVSTLVCLFCLLVSEALGSSPLLSQTGLRRLLLLILLSHFPVRGFIQGGGLTGCPVPLLEGS